MSCTGGGAIPVVADPTGGETFTGREIRPRAWLTLGFDDADRSFALDSYNHVPSYYGGPKAGSLIRIGTVSRQSSDRFSAYKMADVSIDVDDSSRLLSTLEANPTTEHWGNREGRIYLASRERIAAAGTPHTLFRGIWRGHQSKGLERGVSFTDILGSEFSDFNLEATVPRRLVTADDFPGCPTDTLNKVVPIAAGRLSDKTATTVTLPSNVLAYDATLTHAYGVTIRDLFDGVGTLDGRVFAVVTGIVAGSPTVESHISTIVHSLAYGRSVIASWNGDPSFDSYRVYFFDGTVNAFDPQNIDSPTFDFTQVRFLTHDNVTYDGEGGSDFSVTFQSWADGTDYLAVSGTGTADQGRGKIKPLYVGVRTLLDGNPYHEFLIAGSAITEIEGWYLDDVPIHDADNDPHFLGPNHAAWSTAVGANPYVEYNGHRYSVVYAGHNLIGDAIADGSRKLTLNICGAEDVGDGSGDTITRAPRVMYWLLEQWVLQDYQTGAWAAASTSTDLIPWLNSTSFTALEAIEMARVGGEGYEAAIYLDQPLTLRQLLANLAMSFDVRFAQNQFGQVAVAHFDPTVNLTTAIHLTDVREIVEDTSIDRKLEELETTAMYDYDYRPADQTWGHEGDKLTDAQAVTANRGKAAVGDRRQLSYVYDQDTADNVVQHAVAEGAYPPRYVDVICTLHATQVKLWDVVTVTDFQGIGAAGWTDRPLWVLGIASTIGELTAAPTVRLTCLDVDRLINVPSPSPVYTITRGATKNKPASVTSDPAPSGPPSTHVETTGRLVGIQRFTTTGSATYTATAGTHFVIIELVGAGGGGSGVASAGASKLSIGRSGGGGGWLRKKLTGHFDGGTVVVGAGGSGGSAGDNAGSTGGNTTFTDTAGSPTTYTAGGGSPGNNGGSGLAAFPNLSNGVGGGTATGGDDNQPGGGSFAGFVQSATSANSGGGGYSRYGFGGYGSLVFAANSSQGAFNATGKGGGGGSPVSCGTAGALAGGNGGDGLVIIWEYS